MVQSSSESANDHPGRQISSNECRKRAGFSRTALGLANECVEAGAFYPMRLERGRGLAMRRGG